jgi:hypothetical protein
VAGPSAAPIAESVAKLFHARADEGRLLVEKFWELPNELGAVTHWVAHHREEQPPVIYVDAQGKDRGLVLVLVVSVVL